MIVALLVQRAIIPVEEHWDKHWQLNCKADAQDCEEHTGRVVRARVRAPHYTLQLIALQSMAQARDTA